MRLLARPTQFSEAPPQRARLYLLAGLALVAASLLVLWLPIEPSTGSPTSSRITDLGLYQGIVEGMRNGAGYYTAATDALRLYDYPLRPFLTYRLPGLALIQSSIPVPATVALLFALAAATAIAWTSRLFALAATVPAFIIMLFLLAGGMLAFLQPTLAPFHEIWAGLLVALSLALRKPGRWIEAAALGLAAMLIRETAALYVLVMAAMAWIEGARREALGWAAALGVLALVIVCHAWAVAQVTGPMEAASPGWLGLHGPGLFVRAMTLATALQLLPMAAAAILVALSLAGWAALDDPLGRRVALTLGAYAAVISLFARLDTFYWGLMIAPIFLVGLAFVPDALRDLAGSVLDRRRVRVQRIPQ